MGRIATYLFVGALALSLTGCKSKDKDASNWYGSADGSAEVDPYAPSEAPSYGYESTASTYPEYDTSGSEPAYTRPAYTEPMAVEQSYDAAAEPAMDQLEARYHVVAKRDTLYGLARTYYGDQRRWKDIYEANRGEISDPNHIRVGQRLLIP